MMSLIMWKGWSDIKDRGFWLSWLSSIFAVTGLLETGPMFLLRMDPSKTQKSLLRIWQRRIVVSGNKESNKKLWFWPYFKVGCHRNFWKTGQITWERGVMFPRFLAWVAESL